MAYLNVRERRIETTIAYIGGALSGKKTNFAELAKRCAPGRPAVVAEQSSGAEMSFAWRPSQADVFRDCDLSVRVVSSASLGGSDRAREIFRDADGVVVLVDADPDARVRNQETAAALREVLATAVARKLPVVVQVNKTDLAGAVSITSVLDGLGLDAWPHIAAAALRGEGVVETLDRAIGDVLLSLETPRSEADDHDEEQAAPETAVNHTASGGNPLLSALRQVLRETVSEHVSAMEERLASTLTERLIESITSSVEASVAIHTTALFGRLANVERLVLLCEKRAAEVPPALARGLEAQAQKQTQLEERVDARALSMEREMTGLSRGVQGLPQVIVDVVRGEVVRAVEQRSRADREHLATATGQLRRSLDGLVSESKPAETRARLEEMRARIDELVGAIVRLDDIVGDNNAAVAAVAARVDAVAPRVDAAEKRVREGMAERRADIEGALARLREQVAELSSNSDARHAVTLTTQTALTELVEELKKPKKSWFG